MREKHNDTQQLLLLKKLLDLRDSASPFTLVLDTIEQSAKPLLQEYLHRAKSQSIQSIYVAFSTFTYPQNVSHIIRAHELDTTELAKEINRVKVSSKTPQPSRTLLIVDTLHWLLARPSINITAFLSGLITPGTSLVAVYHVDQQVPCSSDFPHNLAHEDLYLPPPLSLLTYLATTILHVHSFHHVLASARARKRSVAPPSYGLGERVEGVLQGLSLPQVNEAGVVIEVEYRRKTGRSVHFSSLLLKSKTDISKSTQGTKPVARLSANLVTLYTHPAYVEASGEGSVSGTNEPPSSEGVEGEVSFNLHLTDKQKRDREKVVLPYHDAQTLDGPGEGGRILYDMGSEDDFDEEEDEI